MYINVNGIAVWKIGNGGRIIIASRFGWQGKDWPVAGLIRREISLFGISAVISFR